MKRSKMVEEIENFILNTVDDVYLNYYVCEKLLTRLEELGMLPPENPKCNIGTIAAGEANEWEPESEN